MTMDSRRPSGDVRLPVISAQKYNSAAQSPHNASQKSMTKQNFAVAIKHVAEISPIKTKDLPRIEKPQMEKAIRPARLRFNESDRNVNKRRKTDTN